MRNYNTAILVAVVAVSLCGCAVGPNYHRPIVAVPGQYYAEQGEAEARSLADLPWWRLFHDPLLVSLIDDALKNGFDVRIAAARVEEARARYGVARSQFFPQVDYQAGFQRGRQNQLVNPNRPTQSAWTLEAGLSWELDLWGRIRRLNESAKAGYLATEEARRGVMLSLVSDVATTYFELRELDVEMEIAKRTREAFQGTYDLFNRRLEGGAASALETSRAEAALESVAAQIPELERAIVAKENQLNFLLGRNPQPIPRQTPLPPLPPAVPGGLPAQLLERRPDVREAEESLIAANANIGVAVANFFPAFSLTGLLGVVSPELNTLFTNSTTWSIAAGMVGPLFHGGQLKSEYEASKAQWQQVKVQYEATVTNALSEVSTALIDREKLVDTVRDRTKSVNAYEEAVRLSNIRYVSGLASYFEVLDAQQQLFPEENLLAQSERDQYLAVVRLYRALGGGWKAEAGGLPPAASPVSTQGVDQAPPMKEQP
ncbi:MAG TPA: efflux transporter outer membrane subunit [Nitrospiria bacterium]|nr:efflux transporter outer membrane subunit [Nitrospiria bacterium]